MEEVAKKTIRSWLDKCLLRIKQQKQSQSLINSLRQTNESFFLDFPLTLGQVQPVQAQTTLEGFEPSSLQSGSVGTSNNNLIAGATLLRRSSNISTNSSSRRRSSNLSAFSDQMSGQHPIFDSTTDETKQEAGSIAPEESSGSTLPYETLTVQEDSSPLEKIEEKLTEQEDSENADEPKPSTSKHFVPPIETKPELRQQAYSVITSNKWKKKSNFRSESMASNSGSSLGSTIVPTKLLKPVEKKDMLKMAKLVASKQNANMALGTPIRGTSKLKCFFKKIHFLKSLLFLFFLHF